jgi:fatty acid desaturase
MHFISRSDPSCFSSRLWHIAIAPMLDFASGVRSEADYVELRRMVTAAGLLDRKYFYYLLRAGSCFVLLGVAVAVAVVLPATWLLLSSLFLAACIVQVALVGHDAGHQEVFRSPGKNWTLGLICWSLLAGVPFWYWNDRHNAHHGHTNDPANDPDIQGGGLLAFTADDARGRTGWRLIALRHQGALIVLAAGLLAFWFRIEGAVYVTQKLHGSRRLIELLLALINVAAWSAAIVLMGWKGAGLFLLAQLFASMYLAALIAPNHKGMPTWARDESITFLQRQVLGSRNVTSHPVWDYIFGGLNYQIEHHLFPTMPRVNLKRCQAMVKPYCEARGLEYTEVDPLTSYRMIRAAYLELQRQFA